MAIYDVSNKEIVNNGLVEIDNDIVDTIKLLNKNEYLTKFSCSSHPGKDSWYIAFVNNKRNIRLLSKFVERFILKFNKNTNYNGGYKIKIVYNKNSVGLYISQPYRKYNTGNVIIDNENIKRLNIKIYKIFKKLIKGD